MSHTLVLEGREGRKGRVGDGEGGKTRGGTT